MTLGRLARLACGALILASGGFALYEAVEAPGSGAIAGVIDRAPPTSPRAPRVALTFDDGPDALVTPGVLDALRARHAVATFFVVGDAARRHPDIVHRAVRDGHEIEDHTRTHAHLDWLMPQAITAEVGGGADDVATVTGHRPHFLRPPFGRRNAATIAAARAAGLRVVTWTVEPRAAADVRRIADDARDGSIVLLHDGDAGRDDRGGYSDESTLVPAVIDALRAHGFSLVTLDALLGDRT